MAETKEITHTRQDAPARADEPYRIPAVDIYETKDNVLLLADMPGVDKEGVSVSVQEGMLEIEGRVAHDGAKDAATLYEEFRPLNYRRVFTLSSDLNTSRIEGVMKGGVLRLTIPKAEEAKVKTIPIKAE